MSGKSRFDYHQIDKILHSRIRLSIVSILAGCDKADFTSVRKAVGATDGNMASHCLKLEKAGYISITKKFIKRKPVTFYHITEQGRNALINYAAKLASLIENKGD